MSRLVGVLKTAETQESNSFSSSAVQKRRVPLSHVDANKGQRVDKGILSPFKSPPMAKKRATTKPPLYTNNVLRKGKRSEPSSLAIDLEEKPKVQRITVSSGPRTSSTDTSQRPGGAGAAAHAKSVKTEAAMAPSLRPEHPPVSTTAQSKVDSRLKPTAAAALSHSGGILKDAKVERGSKCESRSSSTDSASSEVTTSSKGRIDDRIRSQITASRCSKAMKGSERGVEPESRVESSEAPLTRPAIEHPEQVKKEVGDGRLAVQHHEQQLVSFSVEDPPSPCQIPAREEENASALAPPPVSLSPLAQAGEKLTQMGDKLCTAIERLTNFWKHSGLSVTSFGSPVH